jgi:SpoVK/Ycf46/Vps4 family AAA+-type ATPase
MPVIVFFDGMDSIFRTRGSGPPVTSRTRSSPQLLSEIDGVEGLENVIVIGGSNREVIDGVTQTGTSPCTSTRRAARWRR